VGKPLLWVDEAAGGPQRVRTRDSRGADGGEGNTSRGKRIDPPGSLRWLVGPLVNHLSVNSLTTTLQQTRAAVDTQRLAREGLVEEHKGD